MDNPGTWALVNLVLPMGATVMLLGAALVVHTTPARAGLSPRDLTGLLTAAGILTAMLLAYGVGMVLSGRSA